jgi:uncharacterized low-complexity protein
MFEEEIVMKHTKQTALTLALGSAIAASLTAMPVAAAENPFAAQTLEKGYMVAEMGKAKEGACGGMKAKEGKCGYGILDTDKDGKVSKDEFMKGHEDMFNKADANKDGFVDGAEMAKMKGLEGNCAGMKAKEGKCGGMKAK